MGNQTDRDGLIKNKYKQILGLN